jgi:aspartate/tyrosine/aromatic aminotransferase
LTVVTASQGAAEATLSHAKRCIRANYSNPPAHGAAIVTDVLADPTLRAEWEAEVGSMRDRINGMRALFAERMAEMDVAHDFSFMMRQRGMFSMTGLTTAQVDRLREQYSIYMVRSGRINVAGMTADTMDRLCQAIAEVLDAP